MPVKSLQCRFDVRSTIQTKYELSGGIHSVLVAEVQLWTLVSRRGLHYSRPSLDSRQVTTSGINSRIMSTSWRYG